MEHKLLLLTKHNDQYRSMLEDSAPPGLILLGEEPSNIKEADIWLAEPALAAPLLGHATKLKWLQSTFAGVDPLMSPRLRQDYLLTNIKGIFGPLMSEYLFGYLLAHKRQHAKYRQQQQDRVWRPGSFKTLQGQHLLLLGTGSIAEHIATTAKHFGMLVSGINRGGQAVESFDRVGTLRDLSDFIAQADAITNVLPSTPQTRGILDAEILSLIKPNAVLCNLGRGDVLDLEALDVQLSLYPRQQAILDVFNQEPLPTNHPIWSRPNATITPHIAAPSFAEQVMEIFFHNYKLYLTGQSLTHQVCFQQGY
ncbi:MAG: D-2-hydroxyacid dehydrogenase [Shewanella sp.]|nr:D-2-hydroxyacid dehydrogenase [Shewanella sp.]MCF1429423.1 D-2-hydroxyacid dehydrogenase [Shewanella sp.]MCF1438124.1 D-2-hydroxyacid dehydrogenase [Shewanella sp.]MCF1456005.1 D-2-hydroxyacid dehydrogenase [Shewanella sp.]